MAYVVGTTATIVDIAINDAAIFFQCFTASLLVLLPSTPLCRASVRLYVNANIIADDTILALRLRCADSLCMNKRLRGAAAQPRTPPYVQKPLPANHFIPSMAPRSASRPKLLSICYLYRACVDRERSDLEDRRIFARETRLVNEMALKTRSVTGIWSIRVNCRNQGSPAGTVHRACRTSWPPAASRNTASTMTRATVIAMWEMPKMKAFFKGAGHGVLEACLKREHHSETDKPEDGQRRFDDEQRRDLQDDP